MCHTLFQRVQTTAGGHSTLHQGVANEEPGVGYCKRTCLGMHLGTLVAAGGPTTNLTSIVSTIL